MAVKRLSISFDEVLAETVARRAGESDQAVSAWLAEAALRRVQQEELLAAVADFEAEHGPVTAKELGAARRRLGIPST